MTTIFNAVIPDGNGFISHASVAVDSGRVVSVGQEQCGELDLNGDYLLPGFVDVHIHAFMGHDTMGGEEHLRHMSRELRKAGVAAFLPTTMSASAEDTLTALAGIDAVMKRPEPDGAVVLGAHMEAPFLAKEKCGAQMDDYFLAPTWENFCRVTGPYRSRVKMITLAPEPDGAPALIRCLAGSGITVSIGHTAATAEQAHAGFAAGATQATHLFNAMMPLHHRFPGAAGAALAEEKAAVQLICDGIHLHPDILAICARLKGDRAIMITDAMEAAGLPDGAYRLGGQDVFVKEGAARLASGVLAGSTLTMATGLRNLVSFGISPFQAVRMGTANPATSIGESRYGFLRPGCAAVLNRFSPDWRLKEVLSL